MDHPSTPLRSPAAWRGCDLQRQTTWLSSLSENERSELSRALDQLEQERGQLPSLPLLPLPALEATLARWRGELRRGLGFVLARGLPIEGRSPEVVARLYWLLGRALGEPVSQNSAGELLCDIRDTGADADADPDVRLYKTRAEQDFHTDGADIIGLLCLKTARSGGSSRIVSSVTVFNELAARRPDLAPLLFDPWVFRLHERLPPGWPQTFEMPICRRQGEHLSTFFLGWYLRRAQELPDAVRWTKAQTEVIALFEQIASEPALYLDMDFQPGDVQWLKNSVILHKRTAYDDWPEPGRKRHLLRLWLSASDFDDGDKRLRQGMVAPASQEG
jgi:hypothetical protein